MPRLQHYPARKYRTTLPLSACILLINAWNQHAQEWGQGQEPNGLSIRWRSETCNIYVALETAFSVSVTLARTAYITTLGRD